MKTMKLIGVTMMLVLTPSALAVTDGPDPEPGGEQCQNYGVVNQINVSGDNKYQCQAQHCVSGPSGTAAVGTGVGTAAGKGDAGAQASAGTNCSQGNQTRAARTPLIGS